MNWAHKNYYIFRGLFVTLSVCFRVPNCFFMASVTNEYLCSNKEGNMRRISLVHLILKAFLWGGKNIQNNCSTPSFWPFTYSSNRRAELEWERITSWSDVIVKLVRTPSSQFIRKPCFPRLQADLQPSVFLFPKLNFLFLDKHFRSFEQVFGSNHTTKLSKVDRVLFITVCQTSFLGIWIGAKVVLPDFVLQCDAFRTVVLTCRPSSVAV